MPWRKRQGGRRARARRGFRSRDPGDKERVLCGSSFAVSLWSLIGVLSVSVMPLVSALLRDSCSRYTSLQQKESGFNNPPFFFRERVSI